MAYTDLFADDLRHVQFSSGAHLLSGFALPQETVLLKELDEVLKVAPWRHWQTPGGHLMSAGKSNCGRFGWVSSRKAYEYSNLDPDTGREWPAMPDHFLSVAKMAADEVGYPQFQPDGCLLNQYPLGAKMSLHQDLDEKDLGSPVVTISLGLPATFVFGGLQRSSPSKRIRLCHGDVVVWGGASRLAFHGILPIKDGYHPLLGKQRVSLTFRKVI